MDAIKDSTGGGAVAGRGRSRSPLTILLASLVLGARAMAQGAAADPTPEGPPKVTLLEAVTVTDTREKQEKREVPATVDVVPGEEIRRTRPSHPAELLGKVPGVWVSVTGGEGHMTAIRQPLTTSPVYLYLEDGVPTRSTGFFNHNALYEVNVPMAESVEVTKGPGSALYGSDAIGGVVNVITRSPFGPAGFDATIDGGSWGFRRALASGNFGNGSQALRLDANVTHSDGWRDSTGYDRQSFTARFDRTVGDTGLLKTVVAYSHVDQQTAGASTLSKADYESNPTLNLTPISYRKVQAFRVSSSYDRGDETSLLTVVPYFRYDEMEILPNWSLTYDPTTYDTMNTSLGLLTRYRRSFAPMRTVLAAGIDVDYSPGSQVENQINPSTTTLPGGQRVYSSYTVGRLIYDYDVTYFAVSPYASAEFSPLPRLRLSAGLRWDTSSYDYRDRMTTPESPRYLRPEDTTLHYARLSPKLGATYDVSPGLAVFASFRSAFRAPSQGQVFRQGSTADTVGLKPVKAGNLEVGLRATPARFFSVELSAYRLEKRDDILSYRDPVDGATQAVNAGRTRHEGLEAGLSAALGPSITLSAAFSLAKHTYEEWVVDPARGVDYSENEMETAPRRIGRAEVSFSPSFLPRSSAALEWVHLGPYYMDAANTHRYSGHDLLNLRVSAPVPGGLVAFARVTNLLDTRYAENSSYTIQRGEEFAPGAARSVFVGVAWDFRP